MKRAWASQPVLGQRLLASRRSASDLEALQEHEDTFGRFRSPAALGTPACESAHDLIALASEYVFSRQATVDSCVLDPAELKEDPGNDSPGAVQKKRSEEASEPHVSWIRQLRSRFGERTGVHVALVLATLVAMLPWGALLGQQPFDSRAYVNDWGKRGTALATLWSMTLIAIHGFPTGPCLFAASALLGFFGVIDSKQAFAGFSSPCVVAVAALNVIARALQNSGALEYMMLPLLGSPKSRLLSQIRLMVPVAITSAFMNNTSVVAMMIPVVKGWVVKVGVPDTQLMMPLAFASTFGGVMTLIGSGANLVASAWASEHDIPPVGFFELTPLGLLLTVAGMAYLVFVTPCALPATEDGNARPCSLAGQQHTPPGVQYRMNCVVAPPGPFNGVVGHSLRELGVLSVPGAALAEDSPTTDPDKLLQDGDALTFNAHAEAVVRLRKTLGLLPAEWEEICHLGTKRSHRRHYEALVAPDSPLVGKVLRPKDFRRDFRAVPVAVARPGGGTPLRVRSFSRENFKVEAQDMILLEGFMPGPVSGGTDFLFVHEVPDSMPTRAFTKMDLWRQRYCIVGILALVAATTSGFDLALTASVFAISLLLMKALTIEEVFRFMNGHLLLTIAASFGLGSAIQHSGLAQSIANVILMMAAPLGSFGSVIGIYVCGAVLGQLVSNVTTALIALPLAPAMAQATGLPLSRLVKVVIFASNASFATPLSTPTNLMVVPHGRYTFGDFMRVGGPLQLVFFFITISAAWVGFI